MHAVASGLALVSLHAARLLTGKAPEALPFIVFALFLFVQLYVPVLASSPVRQLSSTLYALASPASWMRACSRAVHVSLPPGGQVSSLEQRLRVITITSPPQQELHRHRHLKPTTRT